MFLRYWFEITYPNLCKDACNELDANKRHERWFPYNKGGTYRKWYGNNHLVVDWQNGGKRIHQYAGIPLDYRGAPVRNKQYYFRESITWSALASCALSVRYCKNGFVFDTKGSSCFFDSHFNALIYLGLLNSKVSERFLEYLAPTLDYSVGAMEKIPIPFSSEKLNGHIVNIVNQLIMLSSTDWDSYETSWDFKRHPLV